MTDQAMQELWNNQPNMPLSPEDAERSVRERLQRVQRRYGRNFLIQAVLFFVILVSGIFNTVNAPAPLPWWGIVARLAIAAAPMVWMLYEYRKYRREIELEQSYRQTPRQCLETLLRYAEQRIFKIREPGGWFVVGTTLVVAAIIFLSNWVAGSATMGEVVIEFCIVAGVAFITLVGYYHASQQFYIPERDALRAALVDWDTAGVD